MKVTIKVTETDIKLGERISSKKCPIALAIKRKTDCPISVGQSIIFLGWDVNLSLPKEAARFVICFDAKRSVLPFSFDIDIPEELLLKTNT